MVQSVRRGVASEQNKNKLAAKAIMPALFLYFLRFDCLLINTHYRLVPLVCVHTQFFTSLLMPALKTRSIISVLCTRGGGRRRRYIKKKKKSRDSSTKIWSAASGFFFSTAPSQFFQSGDNVLTHIDTRGNTSGASADNLQRSVHYASAAAIGWRDAAKAGTVFRRVPTVICRRMAAVTE